jgi:hypothetical protein
VPALQLKARRERIALAGDPDGKCCLPPDGVVPSGTAGSRSANFSKAAAFPPVCRKGSLNRTLTLRQNRIAPSENTAA